MRLFILNVWLLSFLILSVTVGQDLKSSGNNGVIHTVTGSVQIDDLHFTLTHEHIMSNFGKEQEETSRYNEAELFKQVIPYLKKLKSLGVNSVFDCTTEYFGRRVDLLKKIADSSGVQIITNTGIYGAAKDIHIPQFAFDASAKALSKIWIDEFKNGIDNTEIRPGFIKLAFDHGPPSEIDTKLFIAGILTHLRTGLTMAVHTGNNLEAVNKQLDLLKKYKLSPSAWVWVHAQHVENVEVLLAAASKGAWISLDAVKTSNVQKYIEIIDQFRSQNLLNKILLSHDGNGFPSGGKIRKFEAISVDLIPAMREHGFSEKEINQIMVQNPKDAFRLEIKKLN